MRHPADKCEHRIHASRAWTLVGLLVAATSVAACHTRHDIEVAPTQHNVKIEPIYMTVDINLRVQRELDEFYSDIVGGEGTPSEQPVESEKPAEDEPSKQGEQP